MIPAIGIFLLLSSTLGPVNVALVETVCQDSGERGVALTLQLACSAADCHESALSEDDCAQEECCKFEQLPVRPFEAQSPEISTSRSASTVVDALLAVTSSVPETAAPSDHAPSHGRPPGPDSAPFAGYLLPLLI